MGHTSKQQEALARARAVRNGVEYVPPAPRGRPPKPTAHLVSHCEVPTRVRGSVTDATEYAAALVARGTEMEAEFAQRSSDLDAREATIAQTKTVRELTKTERQRLAIIQDVSVKHLRRLRAADFGRRGRSLLNTSGTACTSTAAGEGATGRDAAGVEAGTSKHHNKVKHNINNTFSAAHIQTRQNFQHDHRIRYVRVRDILLDAHVVTTDDVCPRALEADSTARAHDKEIDRIIAMKEGAMMNQHGHLVLQFDESKKAGDKWLAVMARCKGVVGLIIIAILKMSTYDNPFPKLGEEAKPLPAGCAMSYALHLQAAAQTFCPGGIHPKNFNFAVMDSCATNVGKKNGVTVQMHKLGWPLMWIVHCLLHILHNAFEHALCHGPAPWIGTEDHARQGANSDAIFLIERASTLCRDNCSDNAYSPRESRLLPAYGWSDLSVLV